MAPSGNSLLDSFGKKGQEPKTLYKEFSNINENARGRKVFRRIVTAIQNSQKHGNPNIVSELRVILDFNEKEVDLKRVDLFFEAVQDWPPERTPNHGNETGARDETWKSDPAFITVQALCLVSPGMAFMERDKTESTPFESAAEAGAAELVEVMLAELLNHLMKEHPDLNEAKKIAQDKYLSGERNKDGKSAFLLAAEELKLEVLKLLLQEYPQLAGMDSVRATIQKTARGQKSQDAALEAFKLIMQHLDMTQDEKIREKIWQEAVKTSSLKVVHYLLKETSAEERARFVTYDNAKFVIQKGIRDMWKEFDPHDRQKLVEASKHKDLLHTAVEYHNADIVEEIIREFPEQIEVDIGPKDKPLYPMQRLRKADQPGHSIATYDRIRNALLHAMIRSTSQDLGIREIRSILRDSKADTICLPLSNIDTEEQSFTEYVQSLQNQYNNMRKIFKFEGILKYANFPDLHSQTSKHSEEVTASLREDHTEISTVFKWLRNLGVKQVLELSVPDRLFSPHSDADVRDCVVGSGIRVLKWRKLDLYLGNLTDKIDLQELHLYSSGNQSVHDQWYRELQSFPNLRRLYVYVVVDVLSENRVDEVKAELQENLDEINRNKLDKRWTKDRQGLESEKVGTDLIRKVPVAEYRWATNTRQRTYRNLVEITNDVVGPNLAAFISKYNSHISAPPKNIGFTRTKVALIDSGVVIVGGKAKTQAHAQAMEGKEQDAKEKGPVSDDISEIVKDSVNLRRKDMAQWSTNDLARRVVDGKSFVNTGDEEEQLWWHASEPHGTQMARLICSMDPCCELYVVKVAETRSSGISANVVAEAIRWAISRNVDVISLSLVAYMDTKEMSSAIREASDKDIVILSSTADEGVITRELGEDKMSLQNNKEVLTIAACDRWGNLLDRSQKEGYEYRFVGNNVHVGQVPFLKSPESISGSSVATAIAAGAASLILACCRISKNCKTEQDGSKSHRWRCIMVRDTFHKMLEGSEQKFVALENLCGKGKKLEYAEFRHTVDTTFKSPMQLK